MSPGLNEASVTDVKQGDNPLTKGPLSARIWNEVLRAIRRRITGPDVIQTVNGWHIRRAPGTGGATLKIPVKNMSGEDAPQGACIDVYDYDGSYFLFHQPDGDDLDTAYILDQEVGAGTSGSEGTGEAWDRGVTAPALMAAAPASRAIIGSSTNSWNWVASDTGTHVAVADEWTGI